ATSAAGERCAPAPGHAPFGPSLTGASGSDTEGPPWLVEQHGPYDPSPGLTLPLLPGSRPPRCSPSWLRLAPPPPARGLRLRGPAGFAPRRHQRRALR